MRVTVGGVPALAMIDTGAEQTLVDLAFVRRARLSRVRLGAPVLLTRAGKTVTRSDEVVELGPIVLGDAAKGEATGAPAPGTGRLTVEGVQALPHDLTDLSSVVVAPEVAEGIDLVLAADVFARQALLLDRPRGEIVVLASKDVLDALGRRYEKGTRFEKLAFVGKPPLARIELELPSGRVVPALLDTGADLTRLTPEAIAEVGGEPVGEATTLDVAARTTSSLHHVKEIALGTTRFQDLRVGTNEGQCLLGWSLYKECVLIVDGPARALWLAVRPYLAAPPTRSGG